MIAQEHLVLARERLALDRQKMELQLARLALQKRPRSRRPRTLDGPQRVP